ncbi:MAG: ribose-phosphate pyrophosphokinase [Nitrospirota bacterium]|nr:ribose-phosphate pyrophosphokinase [Nitrospirota bacterium]
MVSDVREIKIFSGNANIALAQEMVAYLKTGLGSSTVAAFSDGEIRVRIDENVRGHDVFLIQSLSHPVNDHLMELLVMIDAMKRASAQRITAVIPYYAYARQDRKDQPRVPITAKLVADLITTAGASRILTLDLHTGQLQGFFNIPVDHLHGTPVLIEPLRRLAHENIVLLSPDAGGVERTRVFAKRLQAPLAIIDKRREGPNQSQIMNIIGDVAGKTAVILDDMIDTAGTITQGAQAAINAGAKRVLAVATHPVLSGKALERLSQSVIDEVIVTNSIPLAGKDEVCKKIKVYSIAPLLGEAVRRIHEDESVSSLFI